MNGRNRTDRRKHGISFETAVLAFNDPTAGAAFDREVEGDATRKQSNRQAFRAPVAHTRLESDDEMIRIILSAESHAP